VVKTRLVLDAIADATALSVTDAELSERIVLQAKHYGIDPNEYVQRAQQVGELGSLYAKPSLGSASAEPSPPGRTDRAAGLG